MYINVQKRLFARNLFTETPAEAVRLVSSRISWRIRLATVQRKSFKPTHISGYTSTQITDVIGLLDKAA